MARALDSGSLSAFYESVAMMVEAGISLDEAVYVFKESVSKSSQLKRACDTVYLSLTHGESMAKGMRAAGVFPVYAVRMVEAGEHSGRLENVLHSLTVYYSEEDRLYRKVRSAVTYPAAMLVIMTIVLLVVAFAILPIFTGLYSSIADTLPASAYAYIRVGKIVGYLALAIMAVGAICAVAASFMCNGSGRGQLFKVMSVLPVSSDAMYHLALSRFTAALAAYSSAGLSAKDALTAASGMVDHGRLSKRLSNARVAMMTERKSLYEAIAVSNIFDPTYSTLLEVSGHSASTEQTLQNLSAMFFDDALARTDSFVDSLEPVFAAILALSVGATLIAVMLPLVAIMGFIG